MAIIHRGEVLHNAAKRHTLTITEIAINAGYKQSTFYKHIAQTNLEPAILYKYAKVMNNYFIEIPEFTKYLKENGLLDQSESTITNKELIEKVEYWKDQAYNEIRKNNELLQQSIEKEKMIDQLRKELKDLKNKKKQ